MTEDPAPILTAALASRSSQVSQQPDPTNRSCFPQPDDARRVHQQRRPEIAQRLARLRRKLVDQLVAPSKVYAGLAPEAASCPSATLDALQADIVCCEACLLVSPRNPS